MDNPGISQPSIQAGADNRELNLRRLYIVPGDANRNRRPILIENVELLFV